MSYPCIVYKREGCPADYADNIKYRYKTKYGITVIDKDPDTKIPGKLLAMRYSSMGAFFVSDNLNHYNLTIYY